MVVEELKPFNVIKYTTSNGENCTATKKDGVVTIQGDRNGVRQMPLDKFMETFIADQSKKTLERQPEKDKVSFSGNSKSYEEKLEKQIKRGNMQAWLGGLGSLALGVLGLNGKLPPSFAIGGLILSPIMFALGGEKVDNAKERLDIYEAVSNGVQSKK